MSRKDLWLTHELLLSLWWSYLLYYRSSWFCWVHQSTSEVIVLFVQKGRRSFFLFLCSLCVFEMLSSCRFSWFVSANFINVLFHVFFLKKEKIYGIPFRLCFFVFINLEMFSCRSKWQICCWNRFFLNIFRLHRLMCCIVLLLCNQNRPFQCFNESCLVTQCYLLALWI